VDALIVRDQRNGARLVPDVDAVLSRRLRERVDEPGAAAHGLDGEPAPELEAAFHLERLPPPGGGEAHALAAHPERRGQALLDEDLGEIGIAAVLGEARHVVEKLLLGIGAEVRAREFLL